VADYTKQTWVDNDETRKFNATRASVMETGIYDAAKATGGNVALDSFSGADDDAKLTAALTYAAAQTYHPAIVFGNRSHTFNTQGRAPFEGMRLQGATTGLQNPERGSGNAHQAQKIVLNFTGGWFNATTSNVFQCYFGGLTFRGNTTASVVTNSGSGSWYCLHMRDIYASNLASVVGTYSSKLLGTSVVLDGTWNVGNCVDTAISMGGSDSKLLFTQALIDSPTGSCPSAGRPVALYLQSQDKTPVTGLYVTARGAWGAIKVDGPTNLNNGSSSNFGTVWISQSVIEGQNPVYSAGNTYPAYGSLVQVTGGRLSLSQSWLAYGMYDPANGGNGAAIVDVTNGNLQMYDVVYDRAAAVDESVPLVSASGSSKVRVRDVDYASRGGAWVGKPRVRAAGGSLTYDDTVQYVDATALANNAEGGSNTTAVTTGNSGGTSGSPWDAVDITSGAITYSSTQAYKGSLSYKVDNSGTGNTFMYWNTASSRQVALRFYVYLASLPSAGSRIAAFATSGGTNLCALVMDNAGKMSVYDTAGTIVGSTTTNGLSTATWYRVELKMDNSGGSGSGTATLKTYIGDSGSEDTNLGLTHTGQNFGTSNVGRAYFGRWTGGSAVGIKYLDDIAVRSATTSFIGASA
jgi:hypothetical protein